MDYPCAKFGNFSFSHEDIQNHIGGSTLYSRDYRRRELFKRIEEWITRSKRWVVKQMIYIGTYRPSGKNPVEGTWDLQHTQARFSSKRNRLRCVWMETGLKTSLMRSMVRIDDLVNERRIQTTPTNYDGVGLFVVRSMYLPTVNGKKTIATHCYTSECGTNTNGKFKTRTQTDRQTDGRIHTHTHIHTKEACYKTLPLRWLTGIMAHIFTFQPVLSI